MTSTATTADDDDDDDGREDHQVATVAESETQQQQQQQGSGSLSCPLHPNVRGRNGRCPLCAARELKRRNSSESLCHHNDNTICREDEVDGDDDDSLLTLRPSSEGNNLQSRNAEKERSKSVPRNGLSRSTLSLDTSKQQQQQQSSFSSLSQLRHMIRKAQRSVGRFTPDDEYDDAGGHPTNNNDEYEEEEESISSMARDEGKKNFAESKGYIFPVVVRENRIRRSFVKQPQQQQQQRQGAAADSAETDSHNNYSHRGYPLPTSSSSTKQETPPTKEVEIASRSSFSDTSSDVTTSLPSEGSFDTSVESLGRSSPVEKVHKDHITTDSPTSVMEEVVSTAAILAADTDANVSDSSPCCAPLETKKKCHDDDNLPFGPPFDSSSGDDDEEDQGINSSSHCTTVPSSRAVLQPIRSVAVEDVSSDTDDEECTTTTAGFEVNMPPSSPSPSKQSRASSSRPTAASRPSTRQRSFKSALVNNARTSRSKSRSKSRSRARSGSRARSKSRGRRGVDDRVATNLAEPSEDHDHGLVRDKSSEVEVAVEAVEGVQVQQTIVNEFDIDPSPAEIISDLLIPPRKKQDVPKLEPEYLRLCPKHDFPPPPPGIRGPLCHPNYQLGDLAQDSDMIVFPSRKSRKGRRRKRKNDSDEGDSDEDGNCQSSRDEAFVEKAIGQLRHLDAAFVRRSDGSWTYAIMADRTDDSIRFVVNRKGSTKSYPKNIWRSSVRRVRVLTQRKGDLFVVKDGPADIRGMGQRGIARSRSNGRGRLV